MWSYVLTDLTGAKIGELTDAKDRQVSRAMNGVSSASCAVREDHRHFTTLFEEDTLLQVWRDGTLWFNGPVTAVQLSGADSQVHYAQVNAADAAWRLAKRLAGKSTLGEAYLTKDKAIIAKELIEKQNSANDTGIRFGTVSSGTTTTYTAGPYKPVLSCITDLSATLSGFDWRINPVANGTEIGQFEAVAVMGSEKPNITLEHRTGKKNVKNHTVVRDLGGVCNRAYHILEGSSVKYAEDVTSIAQRGVFEEVTDAANVTNATLREQWVENVVSVRGIPRVVLSLALDVEDGGLRVPQIGNGTDEIWLGDRVKAFARTYAGAVLYEGLARIYRLDAAISENGTTSWTPVLVDEGGMSF